MDTRQEKSVEELLKSSAEFSENDLEYFSEKYSPVSEEQKKRIINKGLEKLNAIEKDKAENKETEEITETVTVVNASHTKISWIRSAAAVACICIAAGTVMFAGNRFHNDNQVMDNPEVSEIFTTVTTVSEKPEDKNEAVITSSVSQTVNVTTEVSETQPAVQTTEKITSAVTQTSSASEIPNVIVTENPVTETQVSVTTVPEVTTVSETENTETEITQNTQEITGDWTSDGTVLRFREGVKSISDNGFDKIKGSITKIIIPDGAEEINELAFADFNALEEIIIPDSVRKIGNYAFMNCSSLREAELPSSLEKFSTCIFTGCEIENLVINSGDMVCENASATGGYDKALCIKTVVISEKAGKLSDEFALPVLNAEKLVLSVDAAETLRDGMLSFSRLGSLIIPEGTSVIQDSAFYMVTVPEFIIPSTVKSLGNDVFLNSDCERITVLNPELELEGKLGSFKGIIKGYKDSSAAEYAEKNGCEFQIIG